MKSVEIIGFAGDRVEAPLSPGHEIWGLNQLYRTIEDLRWTRWFEMHDLEFLRGWNPQYVRWLRERTQGIIYMQKHHDEIPMSVAFPREQVNDELGWRFGFSRDYFTSTFSYMLALALHERFEEVGVYGVAFVMDGEAQYERPGLEYLMGIAQGSGVRFHLASTSPLLKLHYVYGYTEPRMNVSDVSAVVDFLRYSQATIMGNLERLLAAYDGAPSDGTYDAASFKADLCGRIIEQRAQKSLLGDLVWWLKHYGRGGALIGRDGKLTRE